ASCGRRFFFSSSRRHTRSYGDWSSDVCSSDLEIAILSEDETAYGGLPDAAAHSTESDSAQGLPCTPEYHEGDRPVHLYYPRDISAIRSAYQEQSIFASGTKSESSSSQPRTVLRPESNSAVHEETDTIAPFSGNDLALTEEAQLYGL